MITEDYVSFETAKLLKEKGFECSYKRVIALEDIIEERFEGRTCVGKELIPAGTVFTPEFGGEYETYDYSPNLFTASAPCPAQAMAMKWLREKHLLHISIDMVNGGNWKYEIDDISCPFDGGVLPKYYCHKSFCSYEEGINDAIKYCLEKLI